MVLRILAALSLAALAASARAQQIDDDARARQLRKLEEMRDRARGSERRPWRPGDAREHDGFYFRADSGVGYMSMAVPVGNQASYAGAGLIGAFHVGGSIQERTILGAQLWAASIPNASLRPSGAGAAPENAAIGTLGLGPELTVYLSPSNVYFSAAAGPSWLTLTDAGGGAGTGDSGISAASKLGLGGRIAVGTEWMFGRKVGLGLAGVGAFSFSKLAIPNLGSGSSQAWHAGLVASFTYN